LAGAPLNALVEYLKIPDEEPIVELNYVAPRSGELQHLYLSWFARINCRKLDLPIKVKLSKKKKKVYQPLNAYNSSSTHKRDDGIIIAKFF
jgi:hypothetical protein